LLYKGGGGDDKVIVGCFSILHVVVRSPCVLYYTSNFQMS
jgi:hypothetical protein